MGGRASIIMVIGFILILSVYQLNMSKRTVRASENVADAFAKALSHQVSVSGMNIAASKLYQDYSWRSGMSNIPFQNGSFTVSFGPGSDTILVYSIGTFQNQSDTVRAYFSGSSIFTDYTTYTNDENGVAWVPGDTVWGPLHTNDVFNHQNKSSIVFYGKVTAGKNIAPPPKSSKTQFLGGYEVGIYLPAVPNINTIINGAGTNGYVFPNAPDTMKIFFISNGNLIIYRNSSPLYFWPGIPLYNLAPNGAIYSAGPIEIWGGTVNTSSIGAVVGSSNTIIFRDEVHYADNPLTNPNSNDLIAFVSSNSIFIDNQTKSNWNMQAVLMAANGSLTATNMNKEGTFNFFGSLYQDSRGNAKMFQSFNKKYIWDSRLRGRKPPFYPGMSNLHLIAWWE